jgi:hypothetical protein
MVFKINNFDNWDWDDYTENQKQFLNKILNHQKIKKKKNNCRNKKDQIWYKN